MSFGRNIASRNAVNRILRLGSVLATLGLVVGAARAQERVDFKGKTFVAGKPVQGKITYPGYEHILMEVFIERVVPERLLSWRWHPAAVDPAVDYSQEPTTLVVFELEEGDGGVLLSVVESGFDKIPTARRAAAFRMNGSGWEQQMKNIEKHVAKS